MSVCSSLSDYSPGLDSPPALSLHDIDEFDDTPFSESFSGFSGWIEAGSSEIAWVGDKSYNIEHITDIRDHVPDWTDDDVDEIMIMSPNPPHRTTQNLATIYEDLDEAGYGPKKTLNIEDFEIFDNLASNTLCRRRGGGQVLAMRRFKNIVGSASQRLSVMTAVNNLCAPFLAKMLCHFVHSDVLHVIMEYGQRGSLVSIMSIGNPLGAQQALVYASEMVEALQSLHLAGIVHRGLCPENIQIDSGGHILLTGFDDAAFLDESNGESNARSYHGIMRSHRGHQCEYRPPEVLLGWETSDASADYWGFGLILYFMLLGRHAFGLDDNVNLHNVLYGGVSLDFSFPLSPAARDLILRCVVKNPRLRLSIAEMKKHEYFSQVDWRKVQDRQLQVPHLPGCVYPYLGGNTSSAPSGLAPPLGRPFLRARVSSNSAISKLSLGNPQSIHSNPCPSIFRQDTSTSERTDGPVSSIAALNSGPPTSEVMASRQSRMEMFWQSLDEELEMDDDIESLPTHKLRKQRSFPVLSSPRLSFLVPKLRKKLGHSSSTLCLRTPEPQSKLDLPQGIEQIGDGIGFTYSLPAAAISKASICSSAPKNCQPFGLGMKKNGGKKSFVETEIYSRCSRSSDLPSGELQHYEQVFSPTSTSSPFTEAGPLTPPQDLFELALPDPEVTKDMSPASTLRLVSPSSAMLSLGSHPFYDLL